MVGDCIYHLRVVLHSRWCRPVFWSEPRLLSLTSMFLIKFSFFLLFLLPFFLLSPSSSRHSPPCPFLLPSFSYVPPHLDAFAFFPSCRLYSLSFFPNCPCILLFLRLYLLFSAFSPARFSLFDSSPFLFFTTYPLLSSFLFFSGLQSSVHSFSHSFIHAFVQFLFATVSAFPSFLFFSLVLNSFFSLMHPVNSSLRVRA